MFKYHLVENIEGELEYELLDTSSGEIVSRMPEVAFMFDASCSVLLKHGHPTLVKHAYEDALRLYREAGLGDEAKDIKCFWGSFDVNEINKCLDICDYIGRFYERMFPAPITKFGALVCEDQ